METKNYYSILGISRTAAPERIKAAFRNLSLKWHPDRNPVLWKELAHDRFIEISEAYETLIDSVKRRQYDLVYERYFENAPSARKRTAKHADQPFNAIRPGAWSAVAPFGRLMLLVVSFFITWYLAMIPLVIFVLGITLFLAMIYWPLASALAGAFILFAALFPVFFILRSIIRAGVK